MSALTRTPVACVAIVGALSAPVAAQIPLGPEFRVDTRGSAVQSSYFRGNRTIAVRPDGGFLVVWNTLDSRSDIVARRFDAAGLPEGPDFVVNSYTEGNHLAPAVGVDGAGNSVVAWTRIAPTPFNGLFGQRFDASGAPLGGEFEIRNATTPSPQAGPISPSVAVAPTGEFLVVWQEWAGHPLSNVLGQRYDAAGNSVGAPFRVNSATTGPRARFPVADVDASGNFVVVWGEELLPGYAGIGQRLAADGTPQGAAFSVSSNSGSQHRLAVARADDGSFVVAWRGGQTYPGPASIFARQFDASGAPRGNDIAVNDPLQGGERPSVDVDLDGDFVVTWSAGPAGQADVFGARFLSSGAPAGSEFRVNTYTTGIQGFSTIASDPAGNFVVAWLSQQNGVEGVFARRYAGGLSPAALAVDPSAGPASDGNGVFEAGESVEVEPVWLNANVGAATFSGTASSFTGPGGPGNPAYTIGDGTAVYGTVASGSIGTCTSAGDCYTLAISLPTARPALHWDASFHEDIAPASLAASKPWTLHVGESFGDVARTSPFYGFVETLLHHEVTAGCGGGDYCPSAPVTREQMAVFVLVAKDGVGTPRACAMPMFADVPAASPFCPFVEELARRGVVAGCGGGNYCPGAPVSREQMAVFVLATKEPGVVPPACGTPLFADVPASSPFCRWIEELARRGVVAGCGGGNYCPSAPVTREQMAVLISAGFVLQLYGP